MLKKLFGGRSTGAPAERDLSIEDLVVLERYPEAIERLEARVKSMPRDLHSHLKLAEVYTLSRMGAKALDQFLFVADSYTDDGFYDKSLALLSKISRLASGDETVLARIHRNQRLKGLEHSRVMAIEGLIYAQAAHSPLERSSPVEVQKVWQGLAVSKLVESLSGEQLKRLFSGSAITQWSAGEVLAERGSAIERLFVIASGQIEAVLVDPASGREVQVRTFGAGDVVGERVLLEHKPWPATYRVTERALLLRVDRAGLEKSMAGLVDPRSLLEALRAQHADRDVAAAVEKLLASPA